MPAVFHGHPPSQGLDFLDPEANRKIDGKVDKVAHRWFFDEHDKKLILEMFAENKLDEHAIEAEAMRIVAPELERFDRLLPSLEWRLNGALRSLAEFRGGWDDTCARPLSE